MAAKMMQIRRMTSSTPGPGLSKTFFEKGGGDFFTKKFENYRFNDS